MDLPILPKKEKSDSFEKDKADLTKEEEMVTK